MSIENQLDANLNKCIDDLVNHSDQYVKRPGRDFTRNRKLTMTKCVKAILSMKGNSLNKELREFSQIINTFFTKSAFVQQRDKILPQFFEDLFHSFNKLCRDKKTLYGYRLFAVDGTDLNIARDRHA